MNKKWKKGIFWGGIIAFMIVVMNGFYNLFGGINVLAAGPHGHMQRGMGGPYRGFEGHHMAGYYHNGFSWFGFFLFLILAIAIFYLVWKWLRRKSKASAMQQFIDTSLLSSYKPMANQNANHLDQWEKNIVNKKENV